MKRKSQSLRPLQEETEIKHLIESLQRDVCVSIWHLIFLQLCKCIDLLAMCSNVQVLNVEYHKLLCMFIIM